MYKLALIIALAVPSVYADLGTDIRSFLTSARSIAEFHGAMLHDRRIGDVRRNLTSFSQSVTSIYLGNFPTNAEDLWSALKADQAVHGNALQDCTDVDSVVYETMQCNADHVRYFLQACLRKGTTSSLGIASGSLSFPEWCSTNPSSIVSRVAQSLKSVQDSSVVLESYSSWDNVTTWVMMDLLRYSSLQSLSSQIPSSGIPFVSEIQMGGGFNISSILEPLTSAVNSVTSAWTSIVGAFKTVSDKKMSVISNLGFSQWAQKSEVFKAVGIPQQYQFEFAQSLMSDYALPANLTSFVLALKYAQQTTWETADALYSPSSNDYYRVKSVYKNGDFSSQMASYFVIDLQFDFNLAPDILDIQTHRSILGGIFESSSEKYQKIPHEITLDDLQKLASFFQLVQAQAVSDTLKNIFADSPSTNTIM